MGVTNIFSEIAIGLGEFVPAFFKALLDGFTGIFLQTTTVEGVATVSLSPVGVMGIVAMVMTITYMIAPTVVNWIKLGWKNRRAKKSTAKK